MTRETMINAECDYVDKRLCGVNDMTFKEWIKYYSTYQYDSGPYEEEEDEDDSSEDSSDESSDELSEEDMDEDIDAQFQQILFKCLIKAIEEEGQILYITKSWQSFYTIVKTLGGILLC